MKEFILHSALQYYLALNFKELFRRDLKKLETEKKSLQIVTSLSNQAQLPKDYDLLSLKFYSSY